MTRALAGLATGLADDDIDALVQMAADFGEAAERLWAVHGRSRRWLPKTFGIGTELLRSDSPVDEA